MQLVYIELKAGKPTEGSLSALCAARQLAGPIHALTLGPIEAASLAPYGVEKVWVVDDERLRPFAPTAAAKAVHQAIQRLAPRWVVAPSSPEANEVLARAAALGGWGFASACTQLAVDGDALNLTRVTWGGSLFQEAQLKGTPALISVDLAAFSPQPSAAPGATTLENLSVTLSDGDFVDQLKAVEKGEKQGVSLADAKVVVGGGRGVGSEEGFNMLVELAGLLNAAVGGSRVVTNNGWRPHSDQIGQTGAQIAPDVYIPCGISGAIQHMVGCKNSKNIIAINKDPDAPIFQRANYGVVGDLHEIIPALMDEVKKLKGK